jgi:hypothetical protein
MNRFLKVVDWMIFHFGCLATGLVVITTILTAVAIPVLLWGTPDHARLLMSAALGAYFGIIFYAVSRTYY